MQGFNLPETKEIEIQSQQIVETTKNLSIVNHADYLAAGEYLKTIKRAQKKVKEIFDDPKKKASDAHKSICALERQFLEPLKKSENECSSKVSQYMIEERRKRQEEERKAREEAERIAREEAEKLRIQQEENRLKTAEMLDSQGFKEEAEQVLSEPEQTPAPIVQVTYQKPEEKEKVQGLHVRSSYSAEVYDLMALVKEVAAGRQPIACLEANTKFLNNQARALKNELRIPGVRVLEKNSTVART